MNIGKVTSEERAAWRERMTSPFWCGDMELTALALRLMDDLEKAEKSCRAHVRLLAERDCLAEALAWGAGKDKKPLFQHLPWMDAKAKWLAYARAWRRPTLDARAD